MARSFRSSALAYVALVSTATAAFVLGCAESAEPDFDGMFGVDASTDAGKRDARTSIDSATPDEDEDLDSGAGGKKEAGTTDSGTKDGSGDGSDAGKPDASDGGGGGVDAGDAGDPTAPKPVQGEVVISEVMYNPSGTETAEEWIEIHNTTATPKLLSGLVLKDGATPIHSHTIRPGLVIAPGAYVVLAASAAGAAAAQVPAAAIVYDYNTGVPTADKLVFGNSDNGSVVLFDGTTEIARAKYGALNLDNAANGQSIQLKTLTYAGAGVAASWCKSSNVWAAGADQGTPGAASDCQ